MVGVFTNQSYKPNIGGAASLKHQQWLNIGGATSLKHQQWLKSCPWLRLLTNHRIQEYCWCRFA
jgi:hypothetical protein